MTLNIMTLSIMTLSIMTLSIMTLRIITQLKNIKNAKYHKCQSACNYWSL
jgi:hypothetical protein